MATTYETPKTNAEESKHAEQEQTRLRAFLNKISNRLWLVIPEDMSAGEFEELMMAIERHCKRPVSPHSASGSLVTVWLPTPSGTPPSSGHH